MCGVPKYSKFLSFVTALVMISADNLSKSTTKVPERIAN